ncbi:MAG: methyltransferase dimerization domain-containing protein, partial [Flavobacteriales bacterium]
EEFRRSKTMFTAVRLGLFDLLDEAPATAAQLAARTGAHPAARARRRRRPGPTARAITWCSPETPYGASRSATPA